MSDKHVLTKAFGESVVRHGDWDDELADFTSIEDAAAETLSKHKAFLYLSGLTSLSDIAAESLSKHEGRLNLSGLTSLSDKAQESLSKHEGDLILSGLTSLSDIAAESFSKHKGELDLSGLTSLSDKAQESLSKHKGDLILSGLTNLSDVAAESFSKHEGRLDLSSLTTLSDKAQESLSKHNGGLSLYRLTSVSDAAVESLVKVLVFPHLDGLTSLSNAAAKSLSKHLRLIFLSNLTSLSDKAAEILSQQHKGELHLDGLTRLSDAATESLSNHRGVLCLDGLTRLSDKAATILGEHKGHLVLDGLTSLSDIAAESLSKHEGKLDLTGLTNLSDKAAIVLKRKGKYRIKLNNPRDYRQGSSLGSDQVETTQLDRLEYGDDVPKWEGGFIESTLVCISHGKWEYDVSGYFDDNIGFASSEQSQFFKRLKRELDNGNYPEVDGQLEYLRRYAIQVVLQWESLGFRTVSQRLCKLAEEYSALTSFADECLNWSLDCLLALEEYEEFLECRRPREPFGHNTHDSNLLLNIQFELGREADPVDLFRLFPNRVTQTTERHPERFRQQLHASITDAAKRSGPWFERIIDHISQKQGYPETPRVRHHLFTGIPFNKMLLPFRTYCFYATYDTEGEEFVDLIGDEIRRCGRLAENRLRKELGLPAVGERWISETELYRAIEQAFPETMVIQHGQPGWLGRQHFDVWLPDWKIAVEYHGLQHFQPVEFFGGEDVFIATQERDERKIRFARENAVELIVVTEETPTEAVIESIRQYRSGRGAQ